MVSVAAAVPKMSPELLEVAVSVPLFSINCVTATGSCCTCTTPLPVSKPPALISNWPASTSNTEPVNICTVPPESMVSVLVSSDCCAMLRLCRNKIELPAPPTMVAPLTSSSFVLVSTSAPPERVSEVIEKSKSTMVTSFAAVAKLPIKTGSPLGEPSGFQLPVFDQLLSALVLLASSQSMARTVLDPPNHTLAASDPMAIFRRFCFHMTNAPEKSDPKRPQPSDKASE